MRLPRVSSVERVSYILDASRGKHVLHLGCADWPYTQEKLAAGTLLHDRIAEVAASVDGFDLSVEGVELMRQSGYERIHLGNAERSLRECLGTKYEVIVAGEIIEHVLNAGQFLESVKSVCEPGAVLILTTPNYAGLKRVLRLPLGREIVHPDHVCYYSIATLSRLLHLTDWQPIDYAVYWVAPRALSVPVNRMLDLFPSGRYFCDGLIVACKEATPSESRDS